MTLFCTVLASMNDEFEFDMNYIRLIKAGKHERVNIACTNILKKSTVKTTVFWQKIMFQVLWGEGVKG